MYGTQFSTPNYGSIYVKSTAYYKCSLLNFLYTRVFPVRCALETEGSGVDHEAALATLSQLGQTADMLSQLRPMFMVKEEVHWRQ